MDGSQLGISFAHNGNLQFQSRGSFLNASKDEFALAKNWAYQHIDELRNLLSDRYIVFGEWLYLKHTIFYDRLPHYFMEYDIYDRMKNNFLSTQARSNLLKNYGFISSVRVIEEGCYQNAHQLFELVRNSAFTSANAKSSLLSAVKQSDASTETVLYETDLSGQMEGLYIKVEDQHKVLARYKFIRGDFLKKIAQSNSHWNSRIPIQNQLMKR